jgi:hypothetical protein
MPRRDGRPAINKLILSLLVLSGIVCVALYMVIGPAPAVKRVESAAQSRTLAYQDKIARAEEESKQQQAAIPETPAPAASAPVPAAPTPESGASASEQEQGATEMAALPPDDGEASDSNALPWQHPAEPNRPPGLEAEADAPMPPPPGAYDDPSDPMAALPGEETDPNAWPGGPADEPQEWVQVLVSGAGMHPTASEDAPMLFAFPYGRTLRVVSRYEGWVEVVDPQSAATGWMQAHVLAPSPPPGAPQEAFYEEEPRERRGIFRRIFGGR